MDRTALLDVIATDIVARRGATSVRLSSGSRDVAAATVAAAGGCLEEDEYDVAGDDGASCCAGVAKPVARLSDIWPPLCMLLSGGPARPLGYLKAETLTRGEPAGPSTPGPPREVGLPAGWADTGSASSAYIDSDSPTAETLSLTVVVDGEEDVATGATLLGSTSSHSLGRGTFDRVK